MLDRGSGSPAAPETLDFDLQQGPSHHFFFRRGPVAAHLSVTGGVAPRVLFAFPAGNTGAGLWIEPAPAPFELAVEGRPSPVERQSGMRGVRAVVSAGTPELSIRGAVLGSIRVLRDFAHHGEVPAAMECSLVPGPPLVLQRTTLDGRHHVELSIEPLDGATITASDERITVTAGPSGRVRLQLTALADDEPLTPIPLSELLADPTAACPRALRALGFLAYEEKLLAGSWRFLTYFGRDTLLTLRMLLPALKPAVIESGIGSVLERLGPGGDVAHEESIGEWAAQRHLGSGHRPADLREPVYDDQMIDDDFLLAPLAAAYLLDHPLGSARAKDFLGRRTRTGRRFTSALIQNLELVMRRAAPFAASPSAATLVRLKEGAATGEWRDSHEGLGLGRVPFSVNAALIPAALEAAARLFASPLLGSLAAEAERATRMLAVWREAPSFFHVELSAAEARARLSAYAASVGVDPEPALASLEGALSFPALALDDAGEPIPVMHSDDSFVLLFTDPDEAYLEEAAARILRPFPAGLRTPVGVVVANPAFSPCDVQRGMFTNAHYHGAVVWSWQQAMLAAGLQRQLAREGLSERTRARLSAAELELWEVIRAGEGWSTAELWTWAAGEGGFEALPFGMDRGHHDESNAAQLWSTVYLAVKPPRHLTL